MAKILLAFFLSVSFSLPVYAATQTSVLSSEKKAVVEQTCVSAQSVIQSVQHNDAATRVNRGQSYETLASRLMTPFNSRVASQGFNDSATSLIDITKKYRQALEDFKDHYQAYDNSLIGALRTKCQKQPDTFYNYLEKAREQRKVLSQDVAGLSKLISEYRAKVETIRSEVE